MGCPFGADDQVDCDLLYCTHPALEPQFVSSVKILKQMAAFVGVVIFTMRKDDRVIEGIGLENRWADLPSVRGKP